jgi:hypothetical protein
LPKGAAYFGVLGQHGVASAIGIQQAGAELDEHLGDERFTAGDAAYQADGFHGVALRGQTEQPTDARNRFVGHQPVLSLG